MPWAAPLAVTLAKLHAVAGAIATVPRLRPTPVVVPAVIVFADPATETVPPPEATKPWPVVVVIDHARAVEGDRRGGVARQVTASLAPVLRVMAPVKATLPPALFFTSNARGRVGDIAAEGDAAARRHVFDVDGVVGAIGNRGVDGGVGRAAVDDDGRAGGIADRAAGDGDRPAADVDQADAVGGAVGRNACESSCRCRRRPRR